MKSVSEMSANLTRVPASSAAFTVATNVNGEVTISEPGSIPMAWMAATSASVPLPTATACAYADQVGEGPFQALDHRPLGQVARPHDLQHQGFGVGAEFDATDGYLRCRHEVSPDGR